MLQVYIGAYKFPNRTNKNDAGICEKFLKKSFIIHPNYKAKVKENDVALLRLSTPYQAASLPCLPLKDETFAGLKATGLLIFNSKLI